MHACIHACMYLARLPSCWFQTRLCTFQETPCPPGNPQPGAPALAAAIRRRRVEAFVERELLAILRVDDGIVRSCVPQPFCSGPARVLSHGYFAAQMCMQA